ncbi:hypothetical protein BGZ73_008548 [Actinomortierella ambigua]|nr:hypothetical protein BGZ73_008548 [Actinomortierella ambigua]
MDVLASNPNFALVSLPIAVGLAYAPAALRVGLTVYSSKKWNNVAPRSHLENQKDLIPKKTYQLIKRAEGAHNNGLEITSIYMAGVLAALYSGMDKKQVAQLASLFVVSRSFYNIFYIFGVNEAIAAARSCSFFVSMYSCLGLLVGAAHTASKKL